MLTSCSGRIQDMMPTAWKTHSVQKMWPAEITGFETSAHYV